jgi:outer membrane protein assembly factor BamB
MGIMKTLYIGIKGRVVCIDRASGRTVWETHLAGSQFVNVQTHDGELLAGTRGELYCLDPESGEIKWHNGLPGMGWGIMSVAGDHDNSAAAAQEVIQRQRQAASSGGGAGTM